MAYDTIINRYGQTITPHKVADATHDDPVGMHRLCSAYLGREGEYGLKEGIFFTGEETSNGQLFVLDVANEILYAVPAAGRAAYESVALVDAGEPNEIAMLIGDDRRGAPLSLYVGPKSASSTAGFLERNGLARGDLHVWVSDDGRTSPEHWNGTGATAPVNFMRIAHRVGSLAGSPAYGDQGYADQGIEDGFADDVGHFQFSRPEHLSINPDDSSQVILASTDRGKAYASDDWGTPTWST